MLVIKYNDNKSLKSFEIIRPRKSREIKYTTRSNRGYIPSLKDYHNISDQIYDNDFFFRKNILEYESWLEHDFYLLLDHDPHCIDVQTQPVELVYETVNGRKEKFYPDIWAAFLNQDGMQLFLFEVKEESELAKLVNDKNWQRKQQVIRDYCQENNRKWHYQIITERKIKCVRLDNIKKCLMAAKHYSLEDIGENEKLKGLSQRLNEILSTREENKQTNTISDVAKILSLYYNEITFEELISVLKYLIYFQQLYIDWDKPLEKTNISFQKIPLTPVSELPDTHFDLNKSEEDQYELNSIEKSYVKLSNNEIEMIYPLISQYGTIAKSEEIRKFAKHIKYTIKEIKELYIAWKNEETFKTRKKQIQPVIERFDTSGKKKEIYSFLQDELQKTKSQANRIYKLYCDFKKEGDIGLHPNRGSSHAKGRFHPLVEEYITYYLNQWHKKGGQIKAIYTALEEHWNKDLDKGIINLKQILDELNEQRPKNKQLTESDRNKLLPTYRAFYDRAKKLPYHETIRKDDKKGGDQIKKGKRGVFREGLYPGYFIQIDHTKADIWVVDEITGAAYVRPWLTFAIDVFSHGIWGFYVTDWDHPNDAPDQETVMNCILNGIVSKKLLPEWKKFEFATSLKKGLNTEVFEWTAAGLPAIIQVDNSKEFMANSVFELCMKLNITLDFRPVKMPSWGGYIESFWDVINDEIRNRELPGRVYPLPKELKGKTRVMFQKPSNYDSQDDASWTLEEFREWLVMYIITKIQQFPRGGELDSPNNLWKYGMSGQNYHVTGGALKLPHPKEIEKIRYESKISGLAILRSEGIRYKNIYYSSGWLRKARVHKVLPEGKNIPFKYSKWDRRYIWVKNPTNGEVETLQAYKYTLDKRIQHLLEESLGLIKGIAPFPLSQKLIDYTVSLLTELASPKGGIDLLLQALTEEFKKKGRIRKKTRKKLNIFFREATNEQKKTVYEVLMKKTVSKKQLEQVGIILDEYEEKMFIDKEYTEVGTPLIGESNDEEFLDAETEEIEDTFWDELDELEGGSSPMYFDNDKKKK